MDAPEQYRVFAADAEVVEVTRPCRDHVRIEFIAPFRAAEPGQFLQLLCADRPGSPSGAPPGAMMLRRPFSIADMYEDGDGTPRAVVISRAIGPGTRWLDRLRPGDAINLTGPLGRPFTLPAPDERVALVGGGVGIPPLIFLARRLRETGHSHATLIFGALTADLFPIPQSAPPRADGVAVACLELPGATEMPAAVTTDDGSAGMAGRVTDALAIWSRAQPAGGRLRVYACGPEPMLQAIARQTRAAGIDCQLCIERMMGCGLGCCLSCVTRVRAGGDGAPDAWRWALACIEGPVFDRDAALDYA